MGAFGSIDVVTGLLEKKGRAISLPHRAGTVYLLPIAFDARLPDTWNGIADYFMRCARNVDGKLVIPSCPEGFFEKKRIQWFSEREILTRPDIRPVFRRSFRHILTQGK